MTIDTPEGIEHYRLCALKGAVKLEALGMKRRGQSATMIAKNELGLSRGVGRDVVLHKLEEKIEEHRKNIQKKLESETNL